MSVLVLPLCLFIPFRWYACMLLLLLLLLLCCRGRGCDSPKVSGVGSMMEVLVNKTSFCMQAGGAGCRDDGTGAGCATAFAFALASAVAFAFAVPLPLLFLCLALLACAFCACDALCCLAVLCSLRRRYK